MKILIRRGDKSIIAPHFTASEFFSKEANAPASHDFYSELVEAVSYLREYYDTPWEITSTYRPDSVGSQHRLGRAVDSQDVASGPGRPSTVILDLVSQLLTPSSEVFVQLRRLGINGFGVYDTFVHLDCRDVATAPASHQDRFGRYSFWDERKKKARPTATPVARPVSRSKKSSPNPSTSKALPGKSFSAS